MTPLTDSADTCPSRDEEAYLHSDAYLRGYELHDREGGLRFLDLHAAKRRGQQVPKQAPLRYFRHEEHDADPGRWFDYTGSGSDNDRDVNTLTAYPDSTFARGLHNAAVLFALLVLMALVVASIYGGMIQMAERNEAVDAAFYRETGHHCITGPIPPATSETGGGGR